MMLICIIPLVVLLLLVPYSSAGEDFLSNWGYTDPLIDQYGQHALCLESKSYRVNASDPRFQKCPKNSCGYEGWRNKHYHAEKYSKNLKYALRRVTHNKAKDYLYLPTTNVESAVKRAGPDDVVHPRKVVGKHIYVIDILYLCHV